MAIIMLGMYTKRAVNAAIFLGSVVVFAGALWLVRSQTTVEDVSWMKAMIPHHSIAILTSERAHITRPIEVEAEDCRAPMGLRRICRTGASLP